MTKSEAGTRATLSGAPTTPTCHQPPSLPSGPAPSWPVSWAFCPRVPASPPPTSSLSSGSWSWESIHYLSHSWEGTLTWETGASGLKSPLAGCLLSPDYRVQSPSDFSPASLPAALPAPGSHPPGGEPPRRAPFPSWVSLRSQGRCSLAGTESHAHPEPITAAGPGAAGTDWPGRPSLEQKRRGRPGGELAR